MPLCSCQASSVGSTKPSDTCAAQGVGATGWMSEGLKRGVGLRHTPWSAPPASPITAPASSGELQQGMYLHRCRARHAYGLVRGYASQHSHLLAGSWHNRHHARPQHCVNGLYDCCVAGRLAQKLLADCRRSGGVVLLAGPRQSGVAGWRCMQPLNHIRRS